jgi:hypothetical protein
MEAAAANNAGERRKPAAPRYADVPLKKEERRIKVSNELKEKRKSKLWAVQGRGWS